jgi:large subunit ribosomal protein L4
MARQGSKRSVQMRGGAVSHGPNVRSHSIKIPKKVRQLALSSILSSKLADSKLFIVDNLDIDSHKTAALSKIIKQWGGSSFLLIDGNSINQNLSLASANIHKILALPSMGINVYDIISHEYLIISMSGLKNVESRYVSE